MFLESKLSLQIACKFPKPWIVISDHLELREQKKKNYTIFILTAPVYTCKAALRLSNKQSNSSFFVLLSSQWSLMTIHWTQTLCIYSYTINTDTAHKHDVYMCIYNYKTP